MHPFHGHIRTIDELYRLMSSCAAQTLFEIQDCESSKKSLSSSQSKPMKDPDEIAFEVELLRKISQGDRGSLSDLYDRYSTVLYSIALRIVNNEAEAEDLLQDVFIMLWEKAGMYDPSRGKPLTWVISLTRNKSIDRLRSLQRRHRLKDEVEKESKVIEMNAQPDSREEVYALEASRTIRAAVAQLSNEQRQAIELAYFSGLTQSEIAEQLNQPLGTIKARIRRGMIKLRTLLANEI